MRPRSVRALSLNVTDPGCTSAFSHRASPSMMTPARGRLGTTGVAPQRLSNRFPCCSCPCLLRWFEQCLRLRHDSRGPTRGFPALKPPARHRKRADLRLRLDHMAAPTFDFVVERFHLLCSSILLTEKRRKFSVRMRSRNSRMASGLRSPEPFACGLSNTAK